MKIIAIYPGRFQPFGRNHKSAYDELSNFFGAENTFIATSDKTGENSPFNFEEKKKIIEKFGISKNNIILTKNPYKAEEITSKFDSNNTAVVFMYGKKDADRIRFKKADGTDGYFQKYEHGNQLNSLSKNGYILVTESSVQMDSIGTISGTVMRQELKNASPRKFKELMGWYDQNLYELIKDKLNNYKLKEEMIFEALLSETNITPTQLRNIENYADSLFSEFGIDIDFGNISRSHFFARLNDPRNVPEISFYELRDIFRKAANKYGKFISSKYSGFSAVLKDMASNINIPFMITLDKQNKELDLIPKTIMRKKDFLNREKSLYLDEGYVIVEGGAAGKLMHPWSNDDLTFLDLKNMIMNIIHGKLNAERYVSEKPDGQNLYITYKDEKIKAARNKTTIQNPIDIEELNSKYSDRGDIQMAFTTALRDLSVAFSLLDRKKLNSYFNNGKTFLNLEILYPSTKNVINYNIEPTIQFHGLITYDDNFNIVSTDLAGGKILWDELQNANATKQRTFAIQPHTEIKINELPNSIDKEDEYLDALSAIKSLSKLSDSSTIEDYKIARWQEFIDNTFPNLDSSAKNILVNRWARGIGGGMTPANFGDDYSKISIFDKTQSKSVSKDIMSSLEILFLKLGVDVLNNSNGYISTNASSTKSEIESKFKEVVDEIKAKNIDNPQINRSLEVIKILGGVEKMAPTEGIVFIYKGNEYKLTGLFSQVNTILGFFRYNR